MNRTTVSLLLVAITVGLVYRSVSYQSSATRTTNQLTACSITGPGWLDATRERLRSASWFAQHKYGDCKDHNDDGYWPQFQYDCLISDQGSGPSASDSARVEEPSGLYYKHMTPGDLLDLIDIPSFSNAQTLVNADVKDIIIKAITDAVRKDPKKFESVSFDSISVGLEGGRNGKTIRSMSMWVHPTIEKIITDSISIPNRVRLLYLPFMKGATGESVNLDDAVAIYTAALNQCGSSAVNGDQSGLGIGKQVGDYTIVVQNWSDNNPSDIFSNFQDCNIHIVRTDACTETTTPKPTSRLTSTISPSKKPTLSPSRLSPTRSPFLTLAPSNKPCPIYTTFTNNICADPDINNDNFINGIDYALIFTRYDRLGAGLKEDLNYDGVVDSLDLSITIKHLGEKPLPTSF